MFVTLYKFPTVELMCKTIMRYLGKQNVLLFSALQILCITYIIYCILYIMYHILYIIHTIYMEYILYITNLNNIIPLCRSITNKYSPHEQNT